MSIVIVGGNERMVCQYEDICKGFGCKAKVFAKEKGAMKKKIGAPDLMILFTSTVSHKMVLCIIIFSGFFVNIRKKYLQNFLFFNTI